MVRPKKVIGFDSDEDLDVSTDEDLGSEIEAWTSVLDDDNLGDDSDSAPEEFTFKAQEEKTKNLQKQALDEIKSQKELIKRKRTEIHERNVHQKKHKMTSRELAAEVLDNLGTSFDADTSILSPPNAPPLSCDEEPEEENKQKDKIFIGTHGSTNFELQVVDKSSKWLKPVSNSAVDFKNTAFNGRKNRRETSTKTFLSKLEKQKIRQKK